jgi:ADP-heptose:LPS heptosyltransferase
MHNKKLNKENIKSILVIKGMGMGDIILGIPLLRNLRNKYPTAKITIMNASGPGREILKNCPYVDEILSLDDAYKGTILKLSFLSNIRKRKFDLVIDSFPTTANTAILCKALKGNIKIGFENNRFSFVYDIKIPFDRKENIVQIEKGILKHFGVNDYDDRLELFFDYKKSPDWTKISNRKLKDTIICISAGKDIDNIRTWNDERWSKIADTLMQQGASVILIGSDDDIERGKNIERFMKEKPLNTIGKMTIKETARLLHATELLLCINGGAMHLATTVGCKVIALNGSSGYFWDAYSKDAVSIRTTGLDCMPCESFQCKLKGDDLYKCMKDITVKKVYKTIEGVLKAQ